MIRVIEILLNGVPDTIGDPLAAGKVYSYAAGTSTLKTLFKDFDLTDPHPNPLTLDSVGKATAYVDGQVKLYFEESDGTGVRTIDYVGTSDSQTTESSLSRVLGDGLLASGNDVTLNIDTTQLEFTSSSKVAIKDGGISGDLFANGAITSAKKEAANYALSTGVATTFSGTASTYTDVTNMSCSITTSGRPVIITMTPHSTGNSYIYTLYAAGLHGIRVLRDSTVVGDYSITGDGTTGDWHAVSGVFCYDEPPAGTYTYKVQYKTDGVYTLEISYAKLFVMELF